MLIHFCQHPRDVLPYRPPLLHIPRSASGNLETKLPQSIAVFGKQLIQLFFVFFLKIGRFHDLPILCYFYKKSTPAKVSARGRWRHTQEYKFLETKTWANAPEWSLKTYTPGYAFIQKC